MKKTWSALIIFVIIGMMTACSTTSKEPSASSEDFSATNNETIAKHHNLDIQNGNMQKNVPSGNFVTVDGKLIFTKTNQEQGRIDLLSYDMATNTVTNFCKDATCDHVSDTCIAGRVESNLEFFNGEVYGKSEQKAGRVMKLNDGRFEPLINGGVSHFFHGRDDLFVATTDSSLVVFEDGNQQNSRTLIEEYTGYWEAICDDYLYYQYGGIHRLNLSEEGAEPETLIENADYITDGKYLYYAKYGDGLLYRCQMDGSNPEQITDRPVLVASWNFDKDYFYFRYYTDNNMTNADSHDIYRFPKDDPTKIEKLVEFPVPVYQIYMLEPDADEMIVISISEENNTENAVYYVSKTGSRVDLLGY
ncbi:MAG: DUF5050 domain-containing protein [Acutalibacter sp.]|nr:DUF5050 domain-containing protein [Acutalibacter sp.]